MKLSKRNVIIGLLVLLGLAVLALTANFVVDLDRYIQAGAKSGGWPNEPLNVPLGSVQVGADAVQFYVDFASDTAVLGFSTKDQAGRPRYFPMRGLPSRDMPAVTLDVFLSDTNEMWVLSSWPGEKVLAYYQAGSDRCLTHFGDNAFVQTPTPENSFGGGGERDWPVMNPARVKKVATIVYPGSG